MAHPEPQELGLELRGIEGAKPLRLLLPELALGHRERVADPPSELDVHPDRVLAGEGEQCEPAGVGEVELNPVAATTLGLPRSPDSSSIAPGPRPR